MNLQVFVPNSPAPWHPNLDIIKKTIHSMWLALGENIRPTFYCDGCPPNLSDESKENYRGFLENLKLLDYGEVKISERWIGLVGLTKWFIRDLRAPVLLNLQHDWEFVDLPFKALAGLVDAMESDERLQVVRFHKRRVPQPEGFHDTYVEDCTIRGIPLCRTNGWGDTPHFARSGHYLGILSRLLSNDYQRDYGRYGVEKPAFRAYREDIRRHGFKAAHTRWGSYVYGHRGERPHVRHLGDSAKVWRMNEEGYRLLHRQPA